MHPHFRKFIAGSQVVGGLAVVAVPMILSRQGFTVAWWYWLLLWSFGGSAMAAGFWLWRDEPRGWKLSRLLQALQIVQFRTSTLGISILAGFQLRVVVSATQFTVGPAFEGSLAITAGQAMPWFVSINFFSAYALYALLRSGPADAPAGADADGVLVEHPADRRFTDRVET